MKRAINSEPPKGEVGVNEELLDSEVFEDSVVETTKMLADQIQKDAIQAITCESGQEVIKKVKKFAKYMAISSSTYTLILTAIIMYLAYDLYQEGVHLLVVGILSFGVSWMLIDMSHKFYMSPMGLKVRDKMVSIIKSEATREFIGGIKAFLKSKYLVAIILAFIIAYLTQNHYLGAHYSVIVLLSLGFAWMIISAVEVLIFVVKGTK